MSKKRKHKTAAQAAEPAKRKIFEEFVLKLEAKPWIPVLFVFAAIYITIAARVDLRLLFTNTILTGGDSCSWLQPMMHLKELIFQKGRLFGWTQSNFFGYNEYQFYFIPPFLIGALLSLIMPATIALKITSILGILTLPVAMFYTGKKLTKNLWAALGAAGISLVFIFNPAYSMFGGNFLSTLAGEFSYSHALTWFVFFIGVTFDTFDRDRSPLLAGILLGLAGLSHMFVFMIACFVPFAFLFYEQVSKINFKWDKPGDKFDVMETDVASSDKLSTAPKNTKRIFEKVALIYLYGFLLMAFWAIPMIFNYRYSQPIAMTWHFQNVKEFFVMTSFWAILIGLLIAVLAFFRTRRFRWSGFFLIYGFLACLFLYILSSFLEVPDIRFIPPALIFTLFAASLFVISRDKIFNEEYSKSAMFVLTSLMLIAGIVFTAFTKVNSDWFNWNYTGFEVKQEFAHLQQMAWDYRGGIDSGRILWEKQNQHDNADFGSERGFENLYMFTGDPSLESLKTVRHFKPGPDYPMFEGRPSMEGIHYGSSFMARPVTYMQSEYSLEPVDPEAERMYSKVNPGVWPLRFWQVNAKDIITYSTNIQALFDAHTNFELTGVYGKFHIYSYKQFPHSYVEVVDPDKVCIVKDSRWGFKTQFYRYFRDYELFDHPFVPLSFAGDLTNGHEVFAHYDDYANKYYDTNFNFDNWLAAYAYRDAVTDESVGQYDIRFHTTEVGKPHIIKVTYYPNFRSVNGEKIYPVSPGFMMIIPQKPDVRIVYGMNKYEIIGLILTLLLIPLALLHKLLDKIALPFSKQLTVAAKVVFFVLIALFVAKSLFGTRKFYEDYNRVEYLAKIGRLDASLALASKYANLDTLDKYDNMIIYKYYIAKANILARQGNKAQAEEIRNYLIRRFRHTREIDYIDYYIPR